MQQWEWRMEEEVAKRQRLEKEKEEMEREREQLQEEKEGLVREKEEAKGEKEEAVRKKEGAEREKEKIEREKQEMEKQKQKIQEEKVSLRQEKSQLAGEVKFLKERMHDDSEAVEQAKQVVNFGYNYNIAYKSNASMELRVLGNPFSGQRMSFDNGGNKHSNLPKKFR